jgi:acetate---CoA ligase (ADP-forming)
MESDPMRPYSLEALFAPQAIAFIGASERPSAPASRGLRNCLRHGFAGGLYPINPKHKTLFGTPCYPALASLPEVPDLAMIALGADATLTAIEACRGVGVKVVVACSAGWEESGPEGAARAARLRELMAGTSMRLLGPNCIGAGNPWVGMSLAYNSSFESLSLARPGRIGLVTQSGAMMGGTILNGEDSGADVGLFAHVGNAMDIGMEEIMEHMLDDPAIDVLAMMIEGLRQPARFVAAARRARALHKPMVVFKAGASELGRQAVMSHTGALAGSDEVFSAVCREQGIVRVDESEDLMPAAALLSSWKGKSPIGRGGLLVFTLSGGAASIIADESHAAGVPIPPLSESTRERITEVLPAYTKVENPLDVGSAVFSDADAPRRSLEAALADPGIDSVLWIGVGAPRDERSRLWIDQALDVMQASQVPGAIASVSGYPQEAGYERARTLRVPVMRSLHSAVALIGKARAARARAVAEGVPGSDIPPLPDGHVIDEVRCKELLARLGIPVPASRAVRRAEDVAEAALALGLPVVVKGIAEGRTHKSEHGLVALALRSAEAAQNAALEMVRRSPSLGFHGFLVEKMAQKGVEVVVGIKRDADFGPVIMFGLGGVSVELFRDVAFGTCPLSAEGARELIALTRAGMLLRGFRGAPPADTATLVEAMVRISQFAAHHAGALREMDVNPIVVLPAGQGVIALDGIIARD